MKIKLAYSTCPNDTFMFDALVHKRINTGNFQFDVNLADIEELNKQASEQINDVTKISFNAFASLTSHFQLLSSGSAMGFGNGPLIISKHKIYPDELHDVSIAIPGEQTTANLLLSILFPDIRNKKVYLFSDIEEVVLAGETDAGLIIHETRFSYHKKGLFKVADLGEMWEEKVKKPLPLGGIAIRRSLPGEIKLQIQKMIQESVEFAIRKPAASLDYVKKYARELDDRVIRQHIDLYVNEYSIHCRKEGREAIAYLVTEAAKIKNLKPENKLFI